MVSISVCMIVKNEEAVLARCLDSLHGIADEIIIVDTGSMDRTKEIAAEYTNQIYDFVWVHDFAAARNFAFSKATKEYIYSADADEVLKEEDRRKFLQLKEVLLPEIEIVEMIYVNPADCNMVYNFRKEPRPKLFKRLREFRWIDPIHETVALDPIVYSSDIEIQHLPQAMHSARDFAAMERELNRTGTLSDRLYSMYAKELFISGGKQEFETAAVWFIKRSQDGTIAKEKQLEALCVAAKHCAMQEDWEKLLSLILPFLTTEQQIPAELYFLLGTYYEKTDVATATEWYLKAAFQAENFVCIAYGGVSALKEAVRLLKQQGRMEEARSYEEMLQQEAQKHDRADETDVF